MVVMHACRPRVMASYQNSSECMRAEHFGKNTLFYSIPCWSGNPYLVHIGDFSFTTHSGDIVQTGNNMDRWILLSPQLSNYRHSSIHVAHAWTYVLTVYYIIKLNSATQETSLLPGHTCKLIYITVKKKKI